MKKILLTLLTVFAITTNGFCATSELLKVRVDDFSGGQNSKDFYDKLQDNQWAILKNAQISSKGQAISRKGQALYGVDVGDDEFNGLGAYYEDTTTSYLVVASQGQVYKKGSSSWDQISTSSIGTDYDTGFIQANNVLFAYNSNTPAHWYDGSSWTAGTVYPTSPPKATTSAWLGNYLFLAGNPDQPDWLYFSENLDPSSFPASNIRKINTGDGQVIKRIEPFRLFELIVYKERSIFLVDITEAPGSGGFTVQPISKDVGTPAPRSVVSLGNDQWFLSSEPYAIRSLGRTQFDKILVDIISRPIQDIFDGTGDATLNVEQVEKAAAVLYDNKYILAIPTNSSSVNNFVIAYDFITQSWITIDGWYPKDWIVYDSNLYYTDATDGRVVQCFINSTGDFGTVADSASGPTVAIDYQLATRGLDFDSPENFKQLDSIGLEFYPTGDYDAIIYINLDNSGWQEVGEVNLVGSALTLPFLLPATLTGEGFTTKTIQLSQYGEFKRIQVRIELNTLEATANTQAVTVYARVKPWRRE